MLIYQKILTSIFIFPLSSVYCENANDNVNGIYNISNPFFNDNKYTDCDMITDICFNGRLTAIMAINIL